MNTELLNQVADLIERTDRFNLAYIARGPGDGRRGVYSLTAGQLLHDCQTTACVAGWTNVLCAGEDSDSWVGDCDGEDGLATAAVRLGLSVRQADRLFYANENSVWKEQADRFGWVLDYDGLENWEDITAAQAATVLREVAAGVIDL